MAPVDGEILPILLPELTNHMLLSGPISMEWAAIPVELGFAVIVVFTIVTEVEVLTGVEVLIVEFAISLDVHATTNNVTANKTGIIITEGRLYPIFITSSPQ